MEEQLNEDIYRIRNGFCLIINIVNFDGREELRRDGSEENVKLIKEAFEYHGFKVNDHCNLNDDQVLDLIDKQVNDKECKLYGAFVLYIHTHGIADKILCTNSYEKNEKNEYVLAKAIHFYEIIELFEDENCEHLLNKPKLIFFDCCRNGESNYKLIINLLI